jgi:Protein of unknown function (DUF2905)
LEENSDLVPNKERAMPGLGKLLLVVGAIISIVGLLLILAERFGLGRLPGDIVVERKNVSFYFPIMTCLILSAVLTLILWLFNGRR